MVRPARALPILFCLIFASALADAATLRGTVLDPQGRAVPGARIRVESPGALPRDASADTEGRFVVTDVAPGPTVVRVFADGFSADPLPVVVPPAGDLSVDPVCRVAAVSDAVVVSAAAVDVPLSSLPASTTVFGRDEVVRSQAETVADVLEQVPGFSVATSGTRGAVTSLFPRGGESDFTLVMLDGIRLNAFGGGLDAAHLPVAGLDQVEVIRGPQSALFGADAIGGVVQLVSRRSGPLDGAAGVEAGGYGVRRGTAEFAGSRSGWSGHASAQYQSSQGLNGTETRRQEVVVNDDYQARAFGAGGGWQNARTDVRGVVHRLSNERGNPGPFGLDPNEHFFGIDPVARGTNDQWLGGGSARLRAGDAVRVRADATVADLDSTYRDGYGESLTESRRATARGQADWAAAPQLSFSAGAEWLGERASNSYIRDARLQLTPVRRMDAGAFGEARYEVAGRLLVAAGLRAERITRDVLPADGVGTRPLLPQDTVTSWNPKLAVSWFVHAPTPGAATRVHANVGTGIRAPDAFELAFTDNPGLKPERSRSLDAGVEQTLSGGRVVVDATWFDNRYDDLIVAVGRAFTDVSRYRTDNIANARARGLEVSASWRTRAGLRLRGGYTWLDSEVLAVDGTDAAPAPFTVGDPLIRRPRHQGFVDASFVGSGFDAFTRVSARGDWLDVDPSYGAFGGTIVAAGFAVVDVGGSWRPAERLPVSVYARVLNLFDRAYEDVLGYPALGRSAVVGVRVAARR